MKIHRLPILFCASLLASCASDSGNKKSTASTPPERKTLSQRMEEKNGYKQDANGNWIPQNDKRSSFESKGQDPNFTKDFKKTEYKAGEFAKKSWWGNKDYGRKEYSGNTDGSRFQKTSDLQDKGAREAGNAAKIPGNYKTEDYATGAAREAGTDAIAKPSNDGIENRRKGYEQPEIIDWREQRALSPEQTKGLLGH